MADPTNPWGGVINPDGSLNVPNLIGAGANTAATLGGNYLQNSWLSGNTAAQLQNQRALDAMRTAEQAREYNISTNTQQQQLGVTSQQRAQEQARRASLYGGIALPAQMNVLGYNPQQTAQVANNYAQQFAKAPVYQPSASLPTTVSPSSMLGTQPIGLPGGGGSSGPGLGSTIGKAALGLAPAVVPAALKALGVIGGGGAASAGAGTAAGVGTGAGSGAGDLAGATGMVLDSATGEMVPVGVDTAATAIPGGAAAAEAGAAPAASSGGILGSIGGGLSSAADAVGGAVWGAGGTGGLFGGGGLLGLGAAAGPIGIAAAAVAGLYELFKGTAHLKANEWVQGFQNPFDKNVGTINEQFYNMANSGQLTSQQAQQMMQQVQQLFANYEQSRQKFGAKGGDYQTVANQALGTFDQYYGNGGSKMLGGMQQVIQRLQAQGK
jgi:hypothetical protein